MRTLLLFLLLLAGQARAQYTLSVYGLRPDLPDTTLSTEFLPATCWIDAKFTGRVIPRRSFYKLKAKGRGNYYIIKHGWRRIGKLKGRNEDILFIIYGGSPDMSFSFQRGMPHSISYDGPLNW